MKLKVLVLECGHSWSSSLQIVFGSRYEFTSLDSELGDFGLSSVDFDTFHLVAVEYSKQVLKDFFALFDKNGPKLENLDWLLLGAPKDVRFQSLMREFGFSYFASDLRSLAASKERMDIKSQSSTDDAARIFEYEMYQRIPLK